MELLKCTVIKKAIKINCPQTKQVSTCLKTNSIICKANKQTYFLQTQTRTTD